MGDIVKETSKGVIYAKKGDNTAFALGKGDWYNVDKKSPEATDVLSKIEKGTEVNIEYNKNGTARYVTKISVVGNAINKSEAKTEEKQKGETKDKEWTPGDKPKEEKTRTYYGSEEDVKGKQRGCALGAAASIVSNPNLDLGDKTLTPENAAQVTLYIAQKFIDWMQA
jgi:hypothetical protein